jgi:2'-5' RNA ligase
LDKARKASRRVLPGREHLDVIRRSARHPLWWLPDPAAQQEEAYRRVWQNLRSVQEVRDGRHDTEEWRARGGAFAMCCIQVPSACLTSEFLGLQSALQQFPWVRLHPETFLHIAVQELGFVRDDPSQRDEMNRARVDEFIAMCERPLVDFPRFPITLGPANSFADAAFLDVHDGGWLSRIHRRMLDFVPVPANTRFPYLPHMSIAHYDRTAPIENLAGVLADWRDQSFGEFVVESIDVVLIDTQETFPPFELVHRFELGTTRATGSFPVRPTVPQDDLLS